MLNIFLLHMENDIINGLDIAAVFIRPPLFLR